MTLHRLWIFFSFIISGQSLSLHPSRELDVFSEAQEATSSVLRISLLPSCSVVFITDGSTPSTTIYKVLENVGMDYNVGVFEAMVQRKHNATFLQYSILIRYVKQISVSSRCMNLVVVGDEAEFLDSFLDVAFNNGLLRWSSRLLVVTRLPYVRFRRRFKEIFSTVNGMVIILEETSISKRCGVYLYLPYSHRRVHVASWTPRFGLNHHTSLQMFPDKFSKLSDGAHFVVSAIGFTPHVKGKKIATGNDGESVFSFNGPGVTLLKILAGRINFTYNMVPPRVGSFGYHLPNGSWNGMIGMVVRKEAEFALGPIGVTYLRSRAIDFTIPLFLDYMRVLGRRGSLTVDPWSFVLAFSTSLWMSIFITLLILKVIVTLFSKLDRNSASSNLVDFYRILLQQDVKYASMSWWERCLIGAWIITVLVLLESYSGNLMSFMAVRYIDHPYQSLRDVIDDPGVKMVWNAKTAYIQYFKAAKSGIFREVAESEKRGRIKYISVYEIPWAVETFVSTTDYVMINPYLTIARFLSENYMEKGQCKYYMGKDEKLPLSFSMVFRKNNPLLTAINEGITGVIEGGLYRYWLKNALPKAGICKNPPMKVTIKSSLSIRSLWGIFVVLIAGYVISLLILLLELVPAKFLLVFNTSAP